MQNIQEAAAAFLACKRVAVTGVSRTPTADFGHKVMRLVYAGHVPKQV